MNMTFTTSGWATLSYWIETDVDIARKIFKLIESIKQNPFKGLGKPEPLKFGLKGYWSRRITGEHRLIYKVTGKGPDQKCLVISCRYHYD